MALTHFVLLGLGLGVGWLWGRSQSPPLLAPRSEAAPPDLVPLDPDPLDADQPEPPQPESAQSLRLAYHMATEMAQFKAGFLARTSHELRSPINSVISLHQLILAGLCDSPEEERDFIAQSAQAAGKMLALLDQLVAIAKMVHGTEQLAIQPVALQDALMEVKSLTHLQAQNRNIRLEIELPDPDLYVLADPRWLRQALLQLVDVPIALMDSGTIRLTTQLDPTAQYLQIWIEDQRPASFWHESTQLLESLRSAGTLYAENRAVAEDAPTPPGLTLLMTQTIVETMGGQLSLLATPATDGAVTRMEYRIPLAVEPDLV